MNRSKPKASNIETVDIALGERSYPIYIGTGLLDRPKLLQAHLCGPKVLVVTNTTIAPLYLDKTLALLDGWQVHTEILPDGEIYKDRQSFHRIIDRLVEIGAHRDTTLIALGGGVIGDLTGFAAATYMRGINFIQIPTTLLAQVDASVGGKTGINHPQGKNLVGAFYQPQCVLIDTDVLSTLPNREFRAGLAEVVKYGLIQDLPFLGWLEAHSSELLTRSPQPLSYAIAQSCRDKAEVVSADERETGRRALLNLGHTFGHAIETASAYDTFLHGEAVSIGMCLAAAFSEYQGVAETPVFASTRTALLAMELPTELPSNLKPQQLVELMKLDKKVLGGHIRLVLLRTLGEAFVHHETDPRALEQFLETCRA